MSVKKNEILFLGIGNDILKDDGIGPWICSRLKSELTHTAVDFENMNVGGLEVLEAIRDYNYVYIFDAIKTTEGTVGDVFLLSRENFRETCHLSSLHDVGFLTALELGEQLGIPVPQEIRIAAVEIREDLVFGHDFTPELQKKIDEIMTIIREEVNNWLSDKGF